MRSVEEIIMKRLSALFSIIPLFLFGAGQALAGIIEFGQEKITFSTTEIRKNATWSNNFFLNETGLETKQLPHNQSQDIWLQTHTFPIGLSWRPPTGANFSVYFDGTLNDADPTYKIEPQIFIRYSCDKLNWSTWYSFEKTDRRTQDRLTIYESRIQLPASAGDSYRSLMQEWWKTNPVWSSDETEFCEWLIKRDAQFFVREKPFIGYVQLRLEKPSVNKAQTIKSMTIEYSWSVGGLASIPKDKTKVRSTTEEKWFFEAKSD
jgi:hypothetical protein